MRLTKGTDDSIYYTIWKTKRLMDRPLPEFISNTTLDTVTSKSKVHIFLSSKVHVVLTIQVQKETKDGSENVSQIKKGA